jgi:acylphosphatase
LVRKHILFSGRVQGVGFRYHSSVLANECRLSGWVHNLSDGNVEMEIQGNPSDIERFLMLIGKDDPYIRIDRMEIADREESNDKGFFERY